MKIAVLHSGDLEWISLGGVDRYIKSIILFCDDNEVTVFGVTRKGQHKIGKVYERVYCDRKYSFIPIMDDSHYPLSIRYMYHILLFIKNMDDYDCIYAQRTEYSVPFLFSKKRNRLIEMIHGSSKYSEVFLGKYKAMVHLTLERIAIRTARKTLVILNREEFGVPYYKSKYKKYSDRFIYGKNPIDTRIFHPQPKTICKERLGLSESKKIILYSGRVENIPKRVNLLPLICQQLKNHRDDFFFVVIGDGADRESLMKTIRSMGLIDCFAFPGYIDNPLTIALYNNAADVCLNLSMFEGTCTSLLEALACGTPIVATDVGDVKEVLYNDTNGMLVKNIEDQKYLVNSFCSAIDNILDQSCKIDDAVLKYDGRFVIEELKEIIRTL